MTGRLPVLTALVLIFFSRTCVFGDGVGTVITVETNKISIDSGSAYSKPVDLSTGINWTKTVRNTRVVIVTAKDCTRCETELTRLRKAGGDFEVMQRLGWKIGSDASNHIQIVDRDEVPDLVQKLGVRQFPTVACVEDGQIVRSFKDGCTTPLDAWTFGWLMKGYSERPASSIPEIARVETTGNYRLRGNHWTLEGDPNPTKQAVVNHLRGPNHAHASVAYASIETWSYEELRSLHDDLHEREGGTVGGFVQGTYNQPAAANQNLDAFSGNRKVLGR